MSFFRDYLYGCLFCFSLSFGVLCGDKFEGFFQNFEDKKPELVRVLLPYNPTVVALNATPEIVQQCMQLWPCGRVLTSMDIDQERKIQADFLWLNYDDSELAILKRFDDRLKNVKVIYTKTHLSNQCMSHHLKLKEFLRQRGFILFAHWYQEQNNGIAIFVQKDIFDSLTRSLNYSPDNLSIAPSDNTLAPVSSPIDRFLRPAENKLSIHSMPNIDFIYMINLDERPEKFALATHSLKLYGIHPYRFSAVNGWKLPNAVFNQIGVRLSKGMVPKKFMGTVYREKGAHNYMSNEFIEEEGLSYFALGMSRGAIGIVLSHLSVLQDAYNSGYKTIWVMEDDVRVLSNPHQISSLIEKLYRIDPQWDILFTDTDTINQNGDHVPCRALAMRPNFPIGPLSSFLQRFYPVSKEFSRTGMRYGAYSMIVRRSGMEKILRFFKTYSVFLPYDMDFWLIPTLKMYHVNEDIVSTIPNALSDNGKPGAWKI